MDAILADFQSNWHVYLSIPLIGAFIGYTTKLVAVEMLFRPLKFRGIPPYLGWQGIVPRFALRMASIAVDLMLARLVDPQEIIEKVDPAELATRLRDPLDATAEVITRRIMTRHHATMWELMPDFAQSLVIKRVQGEIPAVIDDTIAMLSVDVSAVIDLKQVAIDALTRDTALLVRLIRKTGHNELRFIIRSGIPFGFALGTVQMVTWALTHNVWVMPVFGAFTGLATDWLALQMVFRPIEPKRYFGVFRWQGLFHKRRVEVSRDYSELIASEILTPTNIVAGLLDGPNSDKLFSLIGTSIQRAMDTQLSVAKPIVVLAMGGKEFQAMKADVVAEAIAQVHVISDSAGDIALDAVTEVRGIIADKMTLLTDDEYEGLLRPAFKQEEWKIVTIGAILGFLVGELQVHLLLT